jgi:hypothetical protein
MSASGLGFGSSTRRTREGAARTESIELVEHEPLSISQLAAALSEDWPHHDANSLAYALRYLVPVVQVTPRGVWGKTLQPKITTLDGWLGGRQRPR